MSQPEAGPFDQKDSYRNLALEVEGRQFWIPRDALAMYSPVFRTMLYGEFAEANREVIQLRKKTEEIEEFLLCMFPTPLVKPIDDSNADLILGFADEYQIEELRRRCENFLIARIEKYENGDEKLLDILQMASKHRLRSVLIPCVKRCAIGFNSEELRPIFVDLRTEAIAGLMFYKDTTDHYCRYRLTGEKCELGFDDRRCVNCRNLFCCVNHCGDPDDVCSFYMNQQSDQTEVAMRALLNRM